MIGYDWGFEFGKNIEALGKILITNLDTEFKFGMVLLSTTIILTRTESKLVN